MRLYLSEGRACGEQQPKGCHQEGRPGRGAHDAVNLLWTLMVSVHSCNAEGWTIVVTNADVAERKTGQKVDGHPAW